MRNRRAVKTSTAEVPTQKKVFASASPWQVREDFQQLVVGDIHGPAFGPDEILPAHPIPHDRYLVGMLAPSEVRVKPGQNDDSGNAQDESSGDVSSSDRVATVGFFPSSIGISFVVDGAVTELSVCAEWGHYKKERKPRSELEGLPGMHFAKRDLEKEALRVWQRYSRQGTVTVKIIDGDLKEENPVSAFPLVKIRGRARRFKSFWLVTLFMVNDQPSQKENVDHQWLFQPCLTVSDPAGNSIFLERAGVVESRQDETDGELAQLAMLYRDVVEFAVGHGTAVHAEPDPADHTRAVRLTTTNVPTFEVPRTEQPKIDKNPLLGGFELDMKTLARAGDGAFADMLTPVVTAYRDWLHKQERRLGEPAERLEAHQDAAEQALIDARIVADRIEAGVTLLGRDPNAAEAFRFANEAMWRQRIQQIAISHQKNAAENEKRQVTLAEAMTAVDIPKNRSWRLFQLAFFCLNLPSLTDPAHAERADDSALVDLLFFPTGGGKTEAYLGLVAYTFAIRRLQGMIASDDGDLDGSEGVAVLMRYTLRLLTSQQFQRAAALVCACEYLRRERVVRDARWGETPFRLGLWIGSSTTPNWTNDAREAVESARQRDGFTGGQADPLKLTACPWCGATIDTGSNVRIDASLWRTITTCSDPYGDCPFTEKQSRGEGIPVVTVDEEIYRLFPAFVIAGVDKFAQLPWNGALHLLFGRTYQRCTRHGFRSRDLDGATNHVEKDTHRAINGLPEAKTIPCDRLRPPDLIIQDELHLISGPLGTLVGLYETVIDKLASMTLDGVERHRSQLVDYRLVQSDQSSQRPRDQMELVLYDEIGRAETVARDGLRFREAIDSPMRVLFDMVGGAVQIARTEAVTRAPLVRAAEQQVERAVPGQLRELVDGRDDERREKPVYLLVNSDDWDAFAARLLLGEWTIAVRVRAGGDCPPKAGVDPYVAPSIDGSPAPRAGGQFEWIRLAARKAVALPRRLDGFARVVRPVRGCRGTDPQAQAERRFAPTSVPDHALAAKVLARANECSRTLELLRRQQTQRVTHEHGDAFATVEVSVVARDHTLKATETSTVAKASPCSCVT